LNKSIILTCHTDFAVISTDFVRWGWNFTWSTTMPMTFFRILLTNLQKKYFWHLKVKLSLFFRILVWIYFKAENAFFLGIFGGWLINMKKFLVRCFASCKITAPTDKLCGNKSKIRMTSQNNRFVQCFYPFI
jgi:hypothetical protein